MILASQKGAINYCSVEGGCHICNKVPQKIFPKGAFRLHIKIFHFLIHSRISTRSYRKSINNIYNNQLYAKLRNNQN